MRQPQSGDHVDEAHLGNPQPSGQPRQLLLVVGGSKDVFWALVGQQAHQQVEVGWTGPGGVAVSSLHFTDLIHHPRLGGDEAVKATRIEDEQHKIARTIGWVRPVGIHDSDANRMSVGESCWPRIEF